MNDRVVRQKLVDAGFDFVSLTPTGGSRSHEDTESYKKRNSTIEKQIRGDLEPEFTRKAAKLDERETTLDEREESLAEREAKLAKETRRLASERRQVAEQRKVLDDDQERWDADLEKRSSDLKSLDNDLEEFRSALTDVDTKKIAQEAVEKSIRDTPAPLIDSLQRLKNKDGYSMLDKAEANAVARLEAQGQDKAAAFSETWGQKKDAFKKRWDNMSLGERRQAKVSQREQARKQNRDQGFSL